MGLLGKIGKFFRGSPYIFKIKVTPERVQITVSRNEFPIPHEEIIKQNSLPSELLSFLKAQQPNNGRYFLTLSQFMRLNESIRGQTSDYFQWDATEINHLQKIACPDHFKIHWQYDGASQSLNRRLINANAYIGDGWFIHDQKVWQIPSITTEILYWLNLPSIISTDIYRFLSQGLPKFAPSIHQCDIQIETGFQLQVNITKRLKQSFTIQITSNRPDLQKNLTILAGDNVNLLSGNVLLQGLRHKLRGFLLKIAKSGQEVSLSGADLLTVLQDELLYVSDHLNISLEELGKAYPIEDAANTPLRFIMHYEMSQGIGRYYALPGLQVGDEFLPIHKITRQIEKKERFLSMGGRWLEFTPQFATRYADWQQKNIAPIRLAPQEVMGSNNERLVKLGLHAPEIHVPESASEQQQASSLIKTMRQHGLPVGIYGLQQEISGIIGGNCARLLSENKRAKILWITPTRKKSNLLQALRLLNLPYSETKASEGHILVTTPEHLQALGGEWTLTVFQDLDIIAAGDQQGKLLSLLKRAWTISTFNSADWHRDNNRIRRVFQALGLSKEDVKAFMQLCTGTYTQQVEGLFSRLAAPFKKIFVSSDIPSTETGGVPIPPSPVSQPSVNQPKPVYTPSIQIAVSSSTQGQSFVHQAKKLVDYVEKSAQPVPFMQYWPTYDHMSREQKQWYFYWRHQTRQGNYLPADLSYLFLNIYEVIHLVGFPNAQVAVQYLANLWQHYRLQHPKLDGYLIDWIADFHIVYKLPRTAMDWYSHALDSGGKLTDQNLALEAWLSQKAEITTIPDRLLTLISEYQPSKSKFVQQYNQDSSIDQQLRQALRLIDQFIYKEHNASLFDYYKPAEYTTIRRRAFASALYEVTLDVIEVATVPKWQSATGLQSSITTILKYTENLLRKQKNFKGSLRGIEIFAEWASVLDAAFPAPTPEVKTSKKRGTSGKTTQTVTTVVVEPLKIDFTKVGDLNKESNEVRDRLTVKEDMVGESTIISEPVSPITPDIGITTASKETSGFNLERPLDTPAHLLTDLREVAEILGQDQTALSLFGYLKTHQWEVETATIDALLDGAFLTVVLDRINERAIDLLGDQIIFIEGNALVVTEDYRDELEYLIDQTTSMLEAIPQAESSANLDGLTPEWAYFVSQMKPYHWETLHALLTQQDVQSRLDGIARSSYSTVDLLIDEINEFALSSIGDIVIETGDIPVVEEEDVESLRSLLAWALEHELGTL